MLRQKLTIPAEGYNLNYPQKIYSTSGELLHCGDFEVEEKGVFRTYFMTCKCGWKIRVNPEGLGVSKYQLDSIWNSHIHKSGQK